MHYVDHKTFLDPEEITSMRSLQNLGQTFGGLKTLIGQFAVFLRAAFKPHFIIVFC